MDKNIVKIDSDLQDLIPGYLDNRRADLILIRDCLGNGDFETVRRLGHRMKGSGGGYGFDDITEIGAAMEQAAKDGDAANVQLQLVLLEQYLNNLEVVYVQF